VKRRARLTLAVALVAAAVPALAGEVKVSFSNGLVTIVAIDATPRQILAEWARQGQVQITNLDRLAGGPVTVQMTAVPEVQALETLLRGTAGYVAAPRVESVVAASSYDRIMLMPGAAPVTPVAGASSGSAVNMGGGRGRPSNVPAYDATTDDDAETVRQLLGAARDAARSDPYRQPGPGQVVMPGIMPPSYANSPYGSVPGSPATTRQTPATDPAAAGASRQPATLGASTPGVLTQAPQLPPQPIKTTPYSNDGPPQAEAPVAISSPVPGQIVGQPTQTVGAPASTTFQNPYGLPEPVRPPVVNPNANPYGLTAPVKVTPTPTTPPAPIKKSGTDGGQGPA
jgi:hypothetical protein